MERNASTDVLLNARNRLLKTLKMRKTSQDVAAPLLPTLRREIFGLYCSGALVFWRAGCHARSHPRPDQWRSQGIQAARRIGTSDLHSPRGSSDTKDK